MVFNTGPYTDLPDNSTLITANMQSETGFPSSHQLKSYVASKSRLKLAARSVLSADAGLLLFIRLEARLQLNIGFTLRRALTVFTRSDINLVHPDLSRSAREITVVGQRSLSQVGKRFTEGNFCGSLAACPGYRGQQ